MKALIIGSKGQLGLCLIDQLKDSATKTYFYNKKQLDITNYIKLEKTISEINPQVIINTSAYTNVDKAESEKELANIVNNIAVKNLAELCADRDIWLIHISTDYVFNGNSNTPYKEEDITAPNTIYGKTKLKGESAIKNNSSKFIILRTSWVYSEHGNNFFKTMLSQTKLKKDFLQVVDDQIGSPTNAHDLAKSLAIIIKKIEADLDKNYSGIYNFSGNKICTWFQFASDIFKEAPSFGYEIPTKIIPVSSQEMSFVAKRPSYSVLDNTKIDKIFSIKPSDYDKGIKMILKRLSN